MVKIGQISSENERNTQQNKTVEAEDIFSGRETPWISIYISIVMQFLLGVEISVYYMSTWPYLIALDSDGTMDFFGWVIASSSLGRMIANPLFGYWNNRTMSVANPTCVAMLLIGIGQVIYGILPNFESNRKWIMIASRFVIGFGTGNLSVLRAYGATAPHPKDRLRSISLGIAGYVLGVSIGPAIQAAFTPFGEKGFIIEQVLFNMYTVPAFAMALLSVINIFIMKFTFKEDYVGILKQHDREEVILPKSDMIPALVCFYLWVIANMVITNSEVISTPLSTVMYNWTDSESMKYNAILQLLCCLICVALHFSIGSTRLGKIDKRNLVIVGSSMFLTYHIVNYPWFFYEGPLDIVPVGVSTSDVGGCSSNFTWCSETVRVPFFLYIFVYVICLGTAFPMTTTPTSTLFSEILGPRKQGTMQGLYSLGASAAQFVAPILSTWMFENSGIQYVMLTQICALSFGLVLITAYYTRLVPLKLISKEPEEGANHKENSESV